MQINIYICTPTLNSNQIKTPKLYSISTFHRFRSTTRIVDFNSLLLNFIHFPPPSRPNKKLFGPLRGTSIYISRFASISSLCRVVVCRISRAISSCVEMKTQLNKQIHEWTALLKCMHTYTASDFEWPPSYREKHKQKTHLKRLFDLSLK